jgi:hypothetical protein
MALHVYHARPPSRNCNSSSSLDLIGKCPSSPTAYIRQDYFA